MKNINNHKFNKALLELNKQLTKVVEQFEKDNGVDVNHLFVDYGYLTGNDKKSIRASVIAKIEDSV